MLILSYALERKGTPCTPVHNTHHVLSVVPGSSVSAFVDVTIRGVGSFVSVVGGPAPETDDRPREWTLSIRTD